jgi:hypothetical protein
MDAGGERAAGVHLSSGFEVLNDASVQMKGEGAAFDALCRPFLSRPAESAPQSAAWLSLRRSKGRGKGQ